MFASQAVHDAAAEAIEKGGLDGQDGGSGEASLPVKPLAVYFEELTKKRQGMLKKRGRDGDDGGGGGKKGRTALPFDEADSLPRSISMSYDELIDVN